MSDNTQQIQEPQNILIDKDSEFGIQESLVLSILSQVTLTFKGFDFATQNFRMLWIDYVTQESKDEILNLTIEDVTEPNPDYDNNLPTSDTNQPDITYKVGKYIFTEEWLKKFFEDNFNGKSANFNIEIFHLNAAFKIVVDNNIAVSLLDNAIVTPVQGLVPLPFNNPFADIGIRSAIPQETPQGSDELSWKSGYTEPYQRPTNRDGKWIKMGQYNQILYDISKSALTLQDNLSILAKYITDEVDIKLGDVIQKVEVELAKPPADAVLLTGNQNVAGLKNFTGVNANNFKNSPAAVANLEWCNGLPIKNFYDNSVLQYNTNFTCAQKNCLFYVQPLYIAGAKNKYVALSVNSKLLCSCINSVRGTNPANIPYGSLMGFISNKDVYQVKGNETQKYGENVWLFGAS